MPRTERSNCRHAVRRCSEDRQIGWCRTRESGNHHSRRRRFVQEIRIDNTLVNASGETVPLQPGTEVDVTIVARDAPPKETTGIGWGRKEIRVKPRLYGSLLQRMHVAAGEHRYCGKEFKRKLVQGSMDHEVEFKCKVYENGRVVAGPETRRQLAGFSERQVRKGTGVCRDAIRLIRHGKGVKRSTYAKVINFLRENVRPAVQAYS